jgi:hypothetical protein
MASPKVEVSRLDTKCEERLPGVYFYTTGNFEWSFDSTRNAGLNLAIRRAAKPSVVLPGMEAGAEAPAEYTPCLFAHNLHEAVMFSHGWDGGSLVGYRDGYTIGFMEACDLPAEAADAGQ